jgi:hypothetical protein
VIIKTANALQNIFESETHPCGCTHTHYPIISKIIPQLEEDQKKYKIACLVLSVAAAALALKGKLRL